MLVMIEMYNKYKNHGKIVTALEKAGTFWPAEEEHQKFTEKTGVGSCHVDYAPV
jgi:peptide methionine sulfoxide reductase MsrA